MKQNRRIAIVRIVSVVASATTPFLASPANACMLGTWVVKCPVCGLEETVDGGTCQHVDANHHQVFCGSVVTVVCPNRHPNKVDTAKYAPALMSLKCSVDQLECCRYQPYHQ